MQRQGSLKTPLKQKERRICKCVYYCEYYGRWLRRTYGKTTYLSCQTAMYQKEAEDLALLLKETKAAYEKYQEEQLQKKETEE